MRPGINGIPINHHSLACGQKVRSIKSVDCGIWQVCEVTIITRSNSDLNSNRISGVQNIGVALLPLGIHLGESAMGNLASRSWCLAFIFVIAFVVIFAGIGSGPGVADAACGNFSCGCAIQWDCAAQGNCQGLEWFCDTSNCDCLSGTLLCWCES